MHIDGKRIVLTGAASGIGRALLEILACYPAQVLAADRNWAGLDALLATSPARLLAAQVTRFAGDLGCPQTLDALFEQAIHHMGGIDLFIANAGFPNYEKIDRPDWDRLEHIYRVNVFSPIYAAEKIRALNAGRPYKVVITASAMGIMLVPLPPVLLDFLLAVSIVSSILVLMTALMIKKPLEFTACDPLTGKLVQSGKLEAGARLRLPAAAGALILQGRILTP